MYSSAFCDRAEAEREMVAFLGTEAEITEPNHLTMRVGKSRRTWVGNCVAVGLAGGFIEPLESTGLLTVEIGVDQLAQTLEGGDYDDALRDAFNDGFSQLYDNIRDFLVLHFRTAARRDTDYWRACTGDPLMVPARVADFIDRWEHGEVPWTAPWPFAVGSWMYILDGNGRRPGTPLRAGRVPSAVDARAVQRRADARGPGARRCRRRASSSRISVLGTKPVRARRLCSRPPTTCGGRTTSGASGGPSTRRSCTARGEQEAQRRVVQHTSVR